MKKRKYTKEEIDKAYYNKHQYEYTMNSRKYEKSIQDIIATIDKTGKSESELRSMAAKIHNDQMHECVSKKIEKENSKWYKKLWIKSYDWFDNPFGIWLGCILGVTLAPFIAPFWCVGMIIYFIVDNHKKDKKHNEVMEKFLNFDLSTLGDKEILSYEEASEEFWYITF